MLMLSKSLVRLRRNPAFRKMMREKALKEKAEKAKAIAKKYAKSNPLSTYRIRIAIDPLPPYSGSCNEETFKAYGNQHAKEMVEEKMKGLRQNGSGWKYELVGFLKVVVEERTVSLL